MTPFNTLRRRFLGAPAPVQEPTPDAASDPTLLPLHAVDPGEERALALLRDVFPLFRREYERIPREPADAAPDRFRGFHLENHYFESVDAEVSYCLVRHARPKVVLEVGSGYSTLLTRAALDANGAGRLVAIDPEPRASILAAVDEHQSLAVERVDPATFEALEANDVLFIDSSHVVKPGGDVNFLFFDVLPRLRPGVLVHVHDVFLPFDYPAAWQAAGNTEQYLLLAFLSYNTAFRVEWAGAFMRWKHPAEVEAAFPSCTSDTRPGSLWMRRLD